MDDALNYPHTPFGRDYGIGGSTPDHTARQGGRRCGILNPGGGKKNTVRKRAAFGVICNECSSFDQGARPH